MDAVQAMTGSGGWPLNVFLTPEAKPFYGGTYFPPRPIHNRNSWKEVLSGVSAAFRDRRKEVEQQADNLTRHVATAGSFGIGDKQLSGAATAFLPAVLKEIRDRLLASADTADGGFGGAPKFPQTFSIRFLLNDYYYTRNSASLDQACLSLDKMIRGGIYDQLAGGFARYATDREWLVPHFEKMLYDNALLVITLSEAFQLTKKPLYAEAIRECIGFIDKELANGQGGYFSALDADSEGIEGKYYVWDAREIEELLGGDAKIFMDYYGVTEQGNWEGTNILTRPVEGPVSPDESRRLEAARQLLLEYRSRRIPPGLDDKILLGWNALMNMAFSKAFAALGDEGYRDRAIAGMAFLQQRLEGEGLYFYSHSWKGEARQPAFLDDYATLIAALIQLQEITGDAGWLLRAKMLLAYVIEHFSDPETGFFFYTHEAQKDVILRKKEIYDGATPSGNSMMASNLLYLGVVFHEEEWAERARRMVSAMQQPVTTHPGSFGGWATIFQALTYSIPEVVITGVSPENARKEFLAHLIPYRVFQSMQVENTQFPLLRDKPVDPGPLIFLCKDYACQLPVNEVATAVRLLENVYKFQE
jgi:hypothetical protein